MHSLFGLILLTATVAQFDWLPETTSIQRDTYIVQAASSEAAAAHVEQAVESSGFVWSNGFLWSNSYDFEATDLSTATAETAAVNVWVDQE